LNTPEIPVTRERIPLARTPKQRIGPSGNKIQEYLNINIDTRVCAIPVKIIEEYDFRE